MIVFRLQKCLIVAAKGLHPMDCTDIVIGTARGDLSRIADYFTLSRATPKTDDFFDGGDNSLTAAIGSESDGTTTILFRRLLKGKLDLTGFNWTATPCAY